MCALTSPMAGRHSFIPEISYESHLLGFFSSMKHCSELDLICKYQQHFRVKILKKNPQNETFKRKYRPVFKLTSSLVPEN